MAMGQLNGVLRHIHNLAERHEFGPQSDGQLLQRFILNRDEAAFEGLVRRHGPMVHGVCRRVLQRTPDVEDAFQATFLVLVKKADSVRPREMVGNWLYGVAYRIALRARAVAAKRIVKEHEVTTMTRRSGPAYDGSTGADAWSDVQLVLDEELSRLPDKYRTPVVLCDLEGKHRKEVAGQLKVPEGTLSSRLTTGRRMLASRLTRRGITLSGGALATLISENVASAAVPGALTISTMQAVHLASAGGITAAGAISANAAALTQGVLQSMFLTKLKTAMALILAVAFLAGGFGIYAGLQAATQQAGEQPEKKVEQPLKGAAQPEKAPRAKTARSEKAPEKDVYPLEELRSRLKKHEDEVAKIREAMLKEVEDEEKKVKELQKAKQEEAKAAGKPYFGNALTLKLFELNRLRFDITTRYRLPDDGKNTAAAQPEQKLGLHLSNLGGTLRDQLGIAKDQGLLVSKVDADSAAAKAGLKTSDVLVQLQGKKVPSDVTGFRKLLKDANLATVEVVVLRQGKQQTIQNLQVSEAAPAVGKQGTAPEEE